MNNKHLSSYYLPDEERIHVQKVFNSKIWLLDDFESDSDYYAIAFPAAYMLHHAHEALKIRTKIYFAIAKNGVLFKSARVQERNYYLILIGGEHYYNLLSLSQRLQALGPFCHAISKAEIVTPYSYANHSLLDIVCRLYNEYKGIKHIACPQRIDLTMANAALSYILGHEIAHITHGHLDFILSEQFRDVATNIDDKHLTLRTLEMDADSSGTNFAAAYFEEVLKIDQAKRRENLETYETYASKFRIKYIAGIFIARLYSDSLLTEKISDKYPQPYARFLISTEVLERFFDQHMPRFGLSGTPQAVRQLLADTFHQMSGSLHSLGHPMAFNTVVGTDASKPEVFYRLENEIEGKAELFPTFRRWARIRPYLEQFSLGGKLAPADAEPG